MKKIRAILLVIMICATTIIVASLQAYAQGEKSSNNQVLDSEVINGFESRKTALSSLRLDNINKATISQESKYVTQGKNCLHICPTDEPIEEGSYYRDSKIIFYPSNASFKGVEYFSIDIYNPTEKARTVIFAAEAMSKEYIVEPGANTLWLHLDRARLQYVYTNTLSEISLTIQGGDWKMGNLELYIDNFRCYYADTDFVPYTNDFSQDVWYDFNEECDLSWMLAHGTIKSVFSQPLFSINRDIRYIKSGEGSLRVDFRNTIQGAQDTRYIRTSDNQLGNLNSYMEKGGEYYLSFPVYNAYDHEISLSVLIFSNYNDEVHGVSTVIPANSWTGDDFIVTLKGLDEAFSGSGLDVKSIAFYFDGMPDEGTVYVDSIGIYPIQ